MTRVAKFLFILIRDRKFNWVKMYKINWVNPLTYLYLITMVGAFYFKSKITQTNDRR